MGKVCVGVPGREDLADTDQFLLSFPFREVEQIAPFPRASFCKVYHDCLVQTLLGTMAFQLCLPDIIQIKREGF